MVLKIDKIEFRLPGAGQVCKPSLQLNICRNKANAKTKAFGVQGVHAPQ